MATVTAHAPVHRSGWTITEGIVLVIIGILAIASPLVTAAVVAVALPFMLLIEAIVLFVAAFSGRTVGSAVWSVVLGVLSLVAAGAIFAEPYLAIASLPIILGSYLLLKGILQFALGASAPEGKGWIYTSAVLNVLLAILIFAQPFGASLALTGLYIGLSILMLGILLLAAPKAESSVMSDSSVV